MCVVQIQGEEPSGLKNQLQVVCVELPSQSGVERHKRRIFGRVCLRNKYAESSACFQAICLLKNEKLIDDHLLSVLKFKRVCVASLV